MASVNLMQLAPKVDVLCEIMCNDGHWAVQGHSRSPILVRIESQCEIEVRLFINRKSDLILMNNLTYVPSGNISELSRRIGQVIVYAYMGCLYLTPSLGANL